MHLAPRHDTYLGFTTSGFHNIHYVEWGDVDNPDVVICVHGMSRNSRDFDYLAQRLVQYGKRVICPDVPGRGMSDWLSNAQDYNYPKMVGDLVALLARVKATNVAWVGTSMGGLLGLILAAAPDTPIQKLVINDVGPFVPGEPLKKILNYLSLRPTFKTFQEARTFLAKILSSFGPLTAEQLDHLTTYSFRRNLKNKLELAYDPNILKNFSTEDVDLWSFWQTVVCPVFLIRGGNSEVLTKEVAEKMTEKPGVHFVEFPGIGHAPALVSEEQIEAVVRWLI